MARKKRQDGEQIIIKKYANRRLYNTDSSSYVTLDDLAQMVKDNDDFIVKDAKSGEDITHSVLTQIIFEEESKGETLLPVKFLRQLIAMYGDGLQQVVPEYLESSMSAFAENQEKFRTFIVQNMAGTGLPVETLKPFEEMARQNMAIFEKTMSMFAPFGLTTGPGAGPAERKATAGRSAETPAPATESDPGVGEKKGSATGVHKDQLSDLKEQLEAMQKQINSLQQK